MYCISIEESEVSVAITIAFLVFVFMSIIILFIFTSARKVIISNPINIKRINEVIEVF